METQSLCQTIPPPQEFKFHSLEKCSGPYAIPSGAGTLGLELLEFKFPEPDLLNSTEIEEEATRSWDNNTKPDDSISQSGSQRLNQTGSKKKIWKQPANGIVLAVAEDGVFALTRSTFLQQVDTLLAAHKLKEVAMLAHEQQKKLDELKRRSGVSVSDIEYQV